MHVGIRSSFYLSSGLHSMGALISFTLFNSGALWDGGGGRWGLINDLLRVIRPTSRLGPTHPRQHLELIDSESVNQLMRMARVRPPPLCRCLLMNGVMQACDECCAKHVFN